MTYTKKLKSIIKQTPLYKPFLSLNKYFIEIKPVLIDAYLKFVDKILPSGYFIQHTPVLFIRMKLLSKIREEVKSYNEGVNQKAVRDANRSFMINLLIDIANKCDTGDYAELGTYQGNFAKLIYSNMNKDSKLYCFDTFEGFALEDVEIERESSGLITRTGVFSDTSLEKVFANITGNTKDNRLIIKKGYFPDTFQGLENRKWRFVHLDCDLYEPTKKGLELFWPRIVGGGVLLIHDYGASYIGVKKAVDNYFKLLGIVPVPCCDMAGSAVVIKNSK